ncbi:hypothetical protein Nmel_005052 [Mimus melanotis]
MGGNPWSRRGMEKQNCRAWHWQRGCKGAAGSPLCHSWQGGDCGMLQSREDTPGLSQGPLPCGIAGLPPWQGTLQPCSEGKGAVKLGFSPVKSYWALPSAGGESWGCYGCGARPSDPWLELTLKIRATCPSSNPGTSGWMFWVFPR